MRRGILWAVTLCHWASQAILWAVTVSVSETEDLVGCDSVIGQVGGSCAFISRVKQSNTQCRVPEDLHLQQHS